jgi:mevalonate kinase
VHGLTITASAPAKIILFGEHFVIFGQPAVVLAINKRAYAHTALCDDTHIHVHSHNLGLSGFFEKETFKAEKELASTKLTVQKALDKAKSGTGFIHCTSDLVTNVWLTKERYPQVMEPIIEAGGTAFTIAIR